MVTAPVEQQSLPKVNRIGRGQADYRGASSTLCKGCGHDSVTSNIITAFWEAGIEPHRVAKLSGIGCSSKTPTYFLGQAHGFNAVHGRMPAIATGSHLANRTLVQIGVSGDGDTASIGLGHFMHLMRRNVPLIYIIENNGVYGLTKGQFSATAERGALGKSGATNAADPIDCCTLAIQMGCGYVARSFSGDFKQLVPLIQGAIAHRGTSLIDVVSPCITFNNQDASPRSLRWSKEHEDPIHQIGFVPYHAPIVGEVPEEGVRTIDLPDGSRMQLKKLSRDHDPTDRGAALALLEEARRDKLFLTGLLYQNSEGTPVAEVLDMIDEPLASLGADRLRPAPERLAEVMEELM